MREAAEKKRELEKQHGEAISELRTSQAQLGLLASTKNTEPERAQHSQNIESLQVHLIFVNVSGVWEIELIGLLSLKICVYKKVPNQRTRKENGITERPARRTFD